MAAHQLMSAIKSKCTPDEAAQLLRDLPNKFPNGEDNGKYCLFCVEIQYGLEGGGVWEIQGTFLFNLAFWCYVSVTFPLDGRSMLVRYGSVMICFVGSYWSDMDLHI